MRSRWVSGSAAPLMSRITRRGAAMPDSNSSAAAKSPYCTRNLSDDPRVALIASAAAPSVTTASTSWCACPSAAAVVDGRAVSAAAFTVAGGSRSKVNASLHLHGAGGNGDDRRIKLARLQIDDAPLQYRTVG